ncbi:LysM domain-containing protein [Paraphaeosphaeria minitans]|uniref:LysM domain-containing protein n=1 Tax=Paraphaeosphaeria minitans TaxID=565426 RepID=A0A9P6KRR0_9PLEO|nr:LysM domain-containing protein [Paraphaeosphaeria minitans]
MSTQQTLLNSPFDYTEEFAEEFASLTSSCGATQYSYTQPAAYALGTQSSETPLPAPACTQTYTVKADDTCNSISTAFNVSTSSIVLGNRLLSDCSNLAAVGTICIPQACNIYQIQSDDTCDSIIVARASGVSAPQFLAWNPNINTLCSNLGTLRETYICLSPPGGALIAPSPTVSLPMTQPTTPVPRPTNSFPESNGNCGKWYNITTSDTCDEVSISNSISLKDFYFLNPEIDSQCSNLVLGVSYCVQAVGDIQTYPGYPVTSRYITLTSNTFATTTSSAQVKLPLPSRTATSLLPHASGTTENCFAYKNYREIPAIVDQSQGTDLALYTSFINSCDYTRSTWSVTLEDLVAWNPSLDKNNCTMKPGFSYCVLKDENYKPSKQHALKPPPHCCSITVC